jgi:L-serine dehydratase
MAEITGNGSRNEAISVFDIFKIGIGPSSSHTLGPWQACRQFVDSLRLREQLGTVTRVQVELFGSLAKTGKGHGTDLAVTLGLGGFHPETIPVPQVQGEWQRVQAEGTLAMGGEVTVPFRPAEHILFRRETTLPFHPNGMTLRAWHEGELLAEETHYSVGGGFVVQEDSSAPSHHQVDLPYSVVKGDDLLQHICNSGLDAVHVIRRNERVWRDESAIDAGLDRIADEMFACIYRGCHAEGVLPGGLNVVRRAASQNRHLLGGVTYPDPLAWRRAVAESARGFDDSLRWLSAFALAVNEENAAFGRVVTAPTNGAAGVIPAVLFHATVFRSLTTSQIREFLLVAGEIGSIFKKGATISAAMGGCQAEIGVSSAMAAAGLCHVMGGDAARILMAAEIAMEHHLGLTCDPIGGLVQVPCIERNTMGAIKAVTAAQLAVDGDPATARVSLDDVVETMWRTALDMQSKYKETSEGGLAIQIPVHVPEC